MLTHAHQFYTLNRLDDFRRDDWNFISGWCTAIHSELFSPAHVWCVSVHVLEPSLPISGVEAIVVWRCAVLGWERKVHKKTVSY